MNRIYILYIVGLITYALTVWIGIKYYIDNLYIVLLISGVISILNAFLISAVIDWLISSLFPDFLYSAYADLRYAASKRMEKRNKIQETMLFKMQLLPFPTAMQEIEQLFSLNETLKLHRWKVFRAWYKYHKSREKDDPEFYQKLLDNGMTPHELDPYFDPNAPDWEQYDCPHYYDEEDDDDDYDDDDFSDNSNNKKDTAMDWIYRGIGFGMMNSILGGGTSSGGSDSVSGGN